MRQILLVIVAVFLVGISWAGVPKTIVVKGVLTLSDGVPLGREGATIYIRKGGLWQDSLPSVFIQKNGQFIVCLPDSLIAYQLFFRKPGYCEQHIAVYPELGDYQLSITLNPGNLASFLANNKVSWTGKNSEAQEAANMIHHRISLLEVKMMDFFKATRAPGADSITRRKKFDLQTDLLRVEQRLVNTKDPVTRQVLLIEYLCVEAVQQKVMFRKKNPTDTTPRMFDGTAKESILQTVLTAIKPSSALWTINHAGIRWLVKRLALNDELLSYSERIIQEQQTPVVGASVLYGLSQRYQQEQMQEDFVMTLTRLVTDYPALDPTNKAKAEFAMFSNLTVGKPVPFFEIPSIDHPGDTITPASMKGKVWLMEFWTLWCKGCIMALPDLQKLYQQYGREKFDILSVYLDNNLEGVRKFRASKHPMPWKNGVEAKGFNSAIARDFEVTWIPRSLLVGPDGKIIAINPLPDQLEEKLAATIQP